MYMNKKYINCMWKFGSIYWILRDNGAKGTPIFGWGFMRQVSEPYLRGNGPQIRVGKYTFQVGKASKPDVNNDEEGTLQAMDGYYMQSTAEEIGNWP